MNYAVVGFGKMGRAVDEQASRRGHHRVRIVDPDASGRLASKRLDPDRLRGADVAFEFTAPAAAEGNVVALLEAGIPVVCGTTGWTPGASVRRAARRSGVAAVVAPNFSVGMHLFLELVENAARVVGAAGLHDPYVLELHHRGKADAPSGTARRIAEVIARADPRAPTPRAGALDGRLPDGAIHVASVRAGHEPGTHVVGFDGEFDVIELAHRARGRSGFALGAVLAGEWISGKRGVHGFDVVVRALTHKGGRT